MNTLADTDISDIPRYFLQSNFAPFPFQNGILMARIQTEGDVMVVALCA